MRDGWVSTGCPAVDVLLGGHGMAPGRLYELAGVPGIGKTALTIQAIRCLLLADSEAEVLVWDTRGSFPGSRLQDMLAAVPGLSVDQVQACLQRVIVVATPRVASLLRAIEQQQGEPIPRVRLLVIDNISTPFKALGQDSSWERTKVIRHMGMRIRQLARMHRLVVLANNHLTTVVKEDASWTVPFLGESWKACLDFRLGMDFGGARGCDRLVTLTKSTLLSGPILIPPIHYRVLESGVVEESSAGVAS